MRDAFKRLGGDPNIINPLCPADLVIDHSVQVDFSRVYVSMIIYFYECNFVNSITLNKVWGLIPIISVYFFQNSISNSK